MTIFFLIWRILPSAPVDGFCCVQAEISVHTVKWISSSQRKKNTTKKLIIRGVMNTHEGAPDLDSSQHSMVTFHTFDTIRGNFSKIQFFFILRVQRDYLRCFAPITAAALLPADHRNNQINFKGQASQYAVSHAE